MKRKVGGRKEKRKKKEDSEELLWSRQLSRGRRYMLWKGDETRGQAVTCLVATGLQCSQLADLSLVLMHGSGMGRIKACRQGLKLACCVFTDGHWPPAKSELW
jgi:hypothetical protein